jgi:hypothetical protein
VQDVASSQILALVQAQAAVLEQRRVITSSLYGAASCTAYGLQRALLLIECRLNATKKSARSTKVVTRGIWSDIELLPMLGLRLQAFSSVLNCSQSLDHQTGPFPARCDQGSPSAADRLTTSIGALLPIELCRPIILSTPSVAFSLGVVEGHEPVCVQDVNKGRKSQKRPMIYIKKHSAI